MRQQAHTKERVEPRRLRGEHTHKQRSPRLFAFAQYCVVTEAAKTTFGKVCS